MNCASPLSELKPEAFFRLALVVLLFADPSLLHAHGSSDLTPVFMENGENVSLILTEAPNNLTKEDFVYWSFNKKTNLVRFNGSGQLTVFGVYKGRIESLGNNFSVILMNLQDADSGVYTARVFGVGDRQIAGYIITVQAPVSPVNLTVDCVPTSSVSCNLTVSCRAQDAHINSTVTCDNQTCRQEGGERSEVTTSDSVLKVYLEPNGSIICNHSNQVNWTKDMIKIQDVCLQQQETQGSNNTVPLGVSIGIPSFAAVVLAAAGLGYYFYKTRNSRTYSTTAGSDPLPLRPLSNQGPHTGPEAPETRGTAQPESLYAEVAPRSSNNGSI